MSSWEDELDIDDSDILGVFRRIEPSPAASLPRPQLEVIPPANCSSADSLQVVASGVLSRFQMPPRPSQAPFRNATSSIPQALEELDGFDLHPLRKRKRDADTDGCSNLRSLSASMAKHGRIEHREASQIAEVQALSEDNASRDVGGRHRANSNDRLERRASQAVRISHEATDLLHQKKTVSAGRSSLPHAETVPTELHHGEDPERPESHNNASLPLQKDLPYQIPGPAGAVQSGLAQKINHHMGGNRVNSASRSRSDSGASVIDDVDFRSPPLAWCHELH